MKYLLVIFLLNCFLFNRAAGQDFINKSEVRVTGNEPALWVNGKRVPPFAYMSYLGESRYYKEVGDHGMKIYCLPAYLGDQGINSASGIKPFRRSFWIGENKYDFSIIEEEFRKLTDVQPDADVIIRVHLDPPVWWEKANPDEVCRLPDGSAFRVSFSSEQWRKDAGNTLSELLKWLAESEFNRNLIGIHVAGGGTEEWFYHYINEFHDKSKSRQRGFRTWLSNRYQNNVSALRSSWKTDTVTFANAREADISGKTVVRKIYNRMEDTHFLDTYDYQSQVMVDNIKYFSELVKKQSNGRLLTGAFYGYHLFVTDPRRGHGALHQILEFPHLDYLSSPNDYRREPGIDWLPMAAVQSVQLHGKLWLAENDTRTHLTRLLKDVAPDINPEGDWYGGGVWKGPENKETVKGLLWKNAGRMLAYGYGGWWFDMWGGWFSDPEYLSILKKLPELYRDNIQGTPAGYQPEVAVVVDEKLQFYDGTMGQITNTVLSNRYSLGNSGTGFDIFLRSDLSHLETKNYKVVWYLGLESLSDQERSVMARLQGQTPVSLTTDHTGSFLFKKNRLSDEYPGKIRWEHDELRKVFSSGNVHLFTSGNEVVYAGNNWLMIHTTEAGEKIIDLPEQWKPESIIADSKFRIGQNKLFLNAKAGETFLFRIR